MLYRLEIANFCSVLEPQVIDLRIAANVPDVPDRFAPAWRGSDERVPKVVALFGANASGKSNVLKALSFIAWFVARSFSQQPGALLPYEPFLGSHAREEPTRFAIEFGGPVDMAAAPGRDAAECRYRYSLTLGDERGYPQSVIHESLHFVPSGSGRLVRLFERSPSGEVVAGKAFHLTAAYRQPLKKMLRRNASVISTLAQIEHPIAMRLRQATESIASNIFLEKAEFNENAAVGHYAAKRDLLDRLNLDIQRIGLGVGAMNLRENPAGQIVAKFSHDGLALELPIHQESHGTRMFVRLYPLLTQALAHETGGVTIVDEFDLSIHPMLLPEILRWFYDPNRNPCNAQLWVTCQNASLLEDLSKEEIWFCEKDRMGRTSIYGLRDIQAVRRDDNYYRKYLGGVYGAVPHLG